MKEKFSEVYKVSVKSIRFSFDGDIIKDSDTPSSLGLEDDDLIDAKVRLLLIFFLSFPFE